MLFLISVRVALILKNKINNSHDTLIAKGPKIIRKIPDNISL